MTNDSSTGGFIQPSAQQLPSPAPLQDAALDTFLQGLVKGITGLPGNLVLQRWQVTDQNLPPVSTNWASVGVEDIDGDTYAYEAHDPVFPPAPLPVNPTPPGQPSVPANGYDVFITHETIEILTSFYGPNARSNAALLRNGLRIAQNRETMQLAGFGFKSTGKMQAVPYLVNNQWYYRLDLPVTLRREIVLNYPILDIVSAEVTVTSDQGATATIITPKGA